jgi:hypothetical protein
LKIATWNIERLRHKKEFLSIIANCEQADADILVLTETDSRLNLKYKSCFSALPPLSENGANYYATTETRVSIYTNYDFVRQYATFDEHTAICVELKTDIGNVLVGLTVIMIPLLSAQKKGRLRLCAAASPFLLSLEIGV